MFRYRIIINWSAPTSCSSICPLRPVLVDSVYSFSASLVWLPITNIHLGCSTRIPHIFKEWYGGEHQFNYHCCIFGNEHFLRLSTQLCTCNSWLPTQIHLECSMHLDQLLPLWLGTCNLGMLHLGNSHCSLRLPDIS